MTLPMGFRVKFADDTQHLAQGSILLGGTPLTLLRLSAGAAQVLQNGVVEVTDLASARFAERLLANNLGVPVLDGVPTVEAADMTVIIPVRDRSDQLDRALAQLSGARCLVVDDASLDPELVRQTAERHHAELLTLTTNLGPAGARNAGLRVTKTPYVAFVDCDVHVTRDDLLALTRHFADDSVALVGPRVESTAISERPQWFERYDVAISSLTLGHTPCNVRPGAAVAWLPGACLVGRTQALGSGFDAAMRVGEDVDFVWRLIDRGLRVRYDPSIIVRHEARSTIRGWLGRKFFYGVGGASLASRHGNRLAPAVLSPTYALAAAALLIRSRWSIPIAVAALVTGYRAIRSKLPDTPEMNAVAARLALRGLWWAVRQEASLAVRHWWPAAASAALVSRPGRRALTSAIAVDTIVSFLETRNRISIADRAPAALAKRLDDLAYGSGLWWGSLKAGSFRVLLPRRR